MPNGTAPVAMERLRELTVPELYQRNAFRVTGTSTTATRRTIRQHKQHITSAARAGVELPAGELPVPGRRSVEQYGAAFDIIEHPQRRIVDELFWLWDSPDGTCGCAPALHRAHDTAVRAHARALDEELSGRAAGEDNWGTAAASWREVLAHPALWDHLRHRVTALDDRRLDLSALSLLEDEVRRVLITPLAVLAARAKAPQRLVGLLGAWSWAGERLLGEALERQLRPELDSVRTALDRARDLYDKQPVKAASLVEKDVVPQVTRLRAFDTDGLRRPVRTLGDRAALLLNNCVMSSGTGPALPAGDEARLLELALALAETEETRRIVTDNQKYLALGSAVKSMDRARGFLDKDQPERAAAELRQHVLPELTELRRSKDANKRQNVAKLAEATAVLLNNCALALSPSTSPSPAQDSFDLLREAARLANTRKTRKLVRKNRRRLTQHSRLGTYAVAFEAALSGLNKAQDLLRDNKPDRAAAELEERVVPRVEDLAGSRSWRFRFTASKVSDQTAVLLNNCALAMVPEVTSPKQRSIRLLQLALTVAKKGKTRKLVSKNLEGFRYAERVYGNDRLLSTPMSSHPLHRSGVDGLPPYLYAELLGMSPEERAEFLRQYRGLL